MRKVTDLLYHFRHPNVALGWIAAEQHLAAAGETQDFMFVGFERIKQKLRLAFGQTVYFGFAHRPGFSGERLNTALRRMSSTSGMTLVKFSYILV